MELNIGNYIRTKNGKIRKVINDKFYMEIYIETDKGIVDRSHIVKHSKNIIDLIEVGDYVNGCKVITILDGFVDGTMEIKLENTTKIYRTTAMEDIKNVLTKEQFKNVMYEV